MIGRLRGIVEEINDDSLIIDVGGVGYGVFVSTRLLSELSVGEEIKLVIETNVREDHIHLYGFLDNMERDWFRTLATVQGVGNKVAIAILAAYSPVRISQLIMAKDAASFKTISGIGAKLAERIVSELKDKALKLPTSEFVVDVATGSKGNIVRKNLKQAVIRNDLNDDAVSALVNLGYNRGDAYGAVAKIVKNDENQAVDELIKLSLKELAGA
ncbi:MAG: Holliday junction branch migration protein RuvA [Rickettsiales bacterium]